MGDEPSEDRDAGDGQHGSDSDSAARDELTWSAGDPSAADAAAGAPHSGSDPGAPDDDDHADGDGDGGENENGNGERKGEGDDAFAAADGPAPDDPAADDPFAQLAADARAEGEAGNDDPVGDPFEEIDVGDVDAETVWAELDGDGPAAGPSSAARSAAHGRAADDAETAPGAAETAGDPPTAEHVLDKREYCGRCPYFSDPPETACEHDGSEILEVVDRDRFRVRNCPMVTDDGGRPAFDPES